MVDLKRRLLELENSDSALKFKKFSFEFFPAKTLEMQEILDDSIKRLAKLKPNYMTVTYGAGGSTANKTLETVSFIQNEIGIKAAGHLTTVNSDKITINKVIQSYINNNISHIVALRGDMPGMVGKYIPPENGYAYAQDLVAYIKSLNKFYISVAGYPEIHPESITEDSDLSYLKAKIDAGADDIITQYCFDTDQILRYIDKVRSKNINVPVIPGVMLMVNFKQLKHFSSKCGTKIPKWLDDLGNNIDDYPENRLALAVLTAYEQCKILIEHGIDNFHFYCLNRFEVAESLLRLIKK